MDDDEYAAVTETIRTCLRREMALAGFTAKKLSSASGLSECAVRDLLGKVSSPSIHTLLMLAAALGVPITALLGMPSAAFTMPFAVRGRWIAETAWWPS